MYRAWNIFVGLFLVLSLSIETNAAEKPQCSEDNRPPPSPGDANINRNIELVEALNALVDLGFITEFERNLALIGRVRLYGMWDYKHDDDRNGTPWADFGNFNFGAAAAAAGWDRTTAVAGGGAVSFVLYYTGISNVPPGPGIPFIVAPDAEREEDIDEINAGFNYYEQAYGPNKINYLALTPQQRELENHCNAHTGHRNFQNFITPISFGGQSSGGLTVAAPDGYYAFFSFNSGNNLREPVYTFEEIPPSTSGSGGSGSGGGGTGTVTVVYDPD